MSGLTHKFPNEVDKISESSTKFPNDLKSCLKFPSFGQKGSGSWILGSRFFPTMRDIICSLFSLWAAILSDGSSWISEGVGWKYRSLCKVQGWDFPGGLLLLLILSKHGKYSSHPAWELSPPCKRLGKTWTRIQRATVHVTPTGIRLMTSKADTADDHYTKLK